ncbi:MAG: Lrp/AsnC family transcriptional regulator [Hyphomicrobium sp.]|uniref:Lrp/AsnC family transcriptional regulator n=1 Tax=Hyphomicrobium sp. TaxID=82 RepID=UPI003D0BEC28
MRFLAFGVIHGCFMANSRKNIPSTPAEALELDAIDRKILALLQEDNQITNQDLAEKVGISPPPCHRRVKRLREAGIIARDVSLVDPVKVGRSMIVFVQITLERQREDLLESFERKIARCPEVMQCYFVSGDADYLLVVSVPDMAQYNEFARRVFANEPNIRMFRSSFCLARVKYETRIPLD